MTEMNTECSKGKGAAEIGPMFLQEEKMGPFPVPVVS